MTSKGPDTPRPSHRTPEEQSRIDGLKNAISEALMEKEEPFFHTTDDEFYNFVEDLPTLSPRQIYTKLRENGYVGQETPSKSLSLMAFRHVQRIKSIHLHGVDPLELPPKSNHLLIGPTGSGKTFLIELLFRHILKLPTILVDITTYSETGYVGQDVASILTRLMFASEGNMRLAEVGIICLDEFDKIASGQNNAVFAGAGTTKDISGLGVQRELLKLLESTEVTVPTELSHSSYQQHVLMSTANVPFIACGAFSGFKLITQLFDQEPTIGFHSSNKEKQQNDIAVSFKIEEVERTKSFQQYGFLPELIARFVRIVPFKALDEDALRMILKTSLVGSYQKEFELAGIKLTVDNKVEDALISRALKKETGARGLRSVMAQILEDVAFDIYSEEGLKEANVTWVNGQLHLDKS